MSQAALFQTGLVLEDRKTGRWPHYCFFDVSKRWSDRITLEALVRMRRINVMENLKEGIDYIWEGATKIAFRREEDAALFMLFFVPPDECI